MKLLPACALLLLCGCVPLPQMRCLVSPLTGTVVAHGAPLPGATVTRKYHSGWYDEHVVTVTQTDAHGVFEFKGAWKASAVYLVHQPVIDEEIVVSYGSTTQTVLNLTKMDYDRFGELAAMGGNHLRIKDDKLYLACDLGDILIAPPAKPQPAP